MKEFVIILSIVVYAVVNIIDIAYKRKSSKRKNNKIYSMLAILLYLVMAFYLIVSKGRILYNPIILFCFMVNLTVPLISIINRIKMIRYK